MGNQEIRSALAKVTKSDFTSAETISDTYLPLAIQGGAKLQDINAFFSLIGAENLGQDTRQYLSDTMRKCFPQNSSITFDTSESEERWNQQARELWQSGFTSWQHNLNAIQSDQNNRVVLSQNRATSEYEFHFYARCLMLGSNYMLRHVGGEEIKDFQTYFRETFDQSSPEFVFTTMAQSALLALLNSMTNLTTYPEHLSNTLDAMIMATQGVKDGTLFKTTNEGMQLDLLLKRIRQVIQGIIESSESPKDIKTKCVELLTRIGIIAGNPEDLILAAHYQFIHKIDISKHLGFFVKQSISEIFKEPLSAVKQEIKLQEAKKRISGRVSYGGKREDRHNESTKFACDGTYFYSFDKGKGLSRALKTPVGDWEIEQFNESAEIKDLDCVSFLTHKGELYIRHSGLTEEPFKLINKATLTFDSNAPVIKAPEGQQLKFKWTTDQTVEVSDEGKRWMNAAPMASNGRYIYTLAQYRKDDVNSERISTFCEWYELKDNVLNFVSEIKLTDENDVPWIGNKNSPSAQFGGYFDRGMIACNGTLLVWHAKHNVHIFDLKTGNRKKRFDVHSNSNYLTCFDSVTSNFYSGDASVYSYWDVWKIQGFIARKEVENEEEQVDYKLPTIPIVLDEAKKKISEQNKSLNRKQTDFQLNLFSSLIGGQLEKDAQKQAHPKQIEKAARQQDEEQPDADKKPDLTENDWIYEYTRAIILSYISVWAQDKSFFAQNTGDVHLKGSEALQYFKAKHCISISESTLKSLRCSLEQVLENYDCLEAQISQRSSLKSLLHIYIAHMDCLRPLKLSLRQILCKEELELQKKLIEKISKIGLIEGQNQHPAETEELSQEHCFQLHIYHMSKQVNSQTSSLLSSETLEEKLDSMLQTLKTFKEQTESTQSESLIRHLRRFQGADEFAEVFEDDESVLQKMKEIFDETSSLIKVGLGKKVSDMFEDKSKIEDNFKGFGSEETFELVQFNFKFVREALVYYLNQVKAIQENQPIIIDIDERCNKGHNLQPQFGNPYRNGAARCDRCRDMVQDADRGFFRCQTCSYDCCNNCVPRPDITAEAYAEQEKKIKLQFESINKKEKFNEFFYNYMIKACESFKEILRDFSSLILTSDYTNFDEAAFQGVFKKIQALLSGQNSPLSAIQMFAMTIQLYEVDSTDLDEVSEALRNAVEGLNLYLGSSTTLQYRVPEIKEANMKVVDDLSQAHRLISFGLTKVAARLVNGKNSNGQNDSLAKLKIFDKGIAQRHIPLLSDNCKKEIEGSFKITGDAKCRELALTERDEVEYSEDYKQLRMILSKKLQDNQDPDQFAHTKTLLTILRRQAAESDQGEEDEDENLVLHAFATLLLFEDLTQNFSEAREYASNDSNYTFGPEDPILKAYTEACKMRDWMRKRKEALQIKLKLQVTEEFKKDYSSNNPESPPLVELSADDQTKVNSAVELLLKRDLKKTVDNAIKKCDLLLLYETEVEEMQIDVTGMVENNRESNWSAWQPTPVQKRPQVEISEEDLKKQAIERVEQEIFQVIQGDFSSESLQEFIELSQIKGLRRLAGLVMLNKTLSSSDSTVFYDALHVWQASLRGNQSKISHYLAEVQGCGETTSKSIRDQFFEGIKIITEKLKYENDSQRIVQLLNSLIWDYAPSDLEFIAKLSVFDALSGKNSYCKFNQIYCAWGKEKCNYSIENLDRSLEISKKSEYSLSARLRQTFDFLAFKVYSIVYKPDEKLHNKNNSKLKTIGTILMQEIADICRDKLNQHLKMLENTPFKASSERDQEIRFETLSGEVPDSSDIYMVDQCLAFQGKDCIAAIKKQREEFYDKLAIKRLNSFIYQLRKENLSDQLGAKIARNFGLSEANDYEAVVDSIISRDWRVINFLMESEINVSLAVEDDFDSNLKIDPADEQEEEENKLQKIKDSVKEVADEKEKLEQWLNKLKESECKQSPLSQAKLFSQTSIFGFVNLLALLFSLSESSQNSADFLKRVIEQEHVTTLVQVSVLCSSPIQCLVQKIFQSMIRLSMSKNYLDDAVTAAKSDNKTNIIKTIAEVRTCIDMQSSFWQLLYNQIQMTKQAQFNTTDQVELGKPAVVEEITRTFLTIRQKKGQHSNTIIKQIENAVFEIENRTMAEFSALFQLVPSSHLPFVTTGKRCKDAASEESFICLGYVKSNVTTIYKTAISLMPQPDSQIIGLLVNKDGTVQAQGQKLFSVTNLVELHDVESSEIFDNLSEPEKKDFTKEMAQQSLYMNPEIVTKLFNRIIQKESFIRQNPSSAIEHQLLQTFIQRGIFRMIQIFDDAYLYMLKQFSLLEPLINFLSKEAAQQIFKPNEPLVSSELLMQLLNQVFVSATHTNRSAGKYSKLLLYIKDQDKQAAFLQRMADGENSAEFLNIEIVYTCGDQGRTIPSKCTNSQDHQLTNQFGDAQSDTTEDLRCGMCKDYINLTEKVKQKKTGLLKCMECQNSECYFCNQCLPKPQLNTDCGLEVEIYSECFFRIARHEAILIKSETLATLSEEILGTILMSNVVITDDKLPLLTIFEALAEKIISDKRWKECSTTRFVVVKEVSFIRAKEFLAGEKISGAENTRGQILTKICKYVDVAKDAINDPKRAKNLVCEFLSNLDANSEDFLSNLVPEILGKYFGEAADEGDLAKQKEQQKLMKQLQRMSEEKIPVLKAADNFYSGTKDDENRNQNTTPNFMDKFTSESKKIIEEGGEEFFKPFRTNELSEFQRYYDSIVFETTNENPDQLQRAQLGPTINKINQIVARSIWLLVISNESYCQDIEARNLFNTEAMHRKIFDLIHESNMAASHQRIFMGAMLAQNDVREQIQRVLKFFDALPDGEKFRKSFVQDFMIRADLTIDQIKKDQYQELQNYCVKDLRKLSKLHNVLDPSNLIFLSKEIFSNQNYLVPGQKEDMAKMLFDLHLGFAIIFKSQDDYSISQDLIKGCSWALDMLIGNLDGFLIKHNDVNSILEGDLIKQLFDFMNKSTEVSSKKKQLTEIILKLSLIFYKNRERNRENAASETPFERTDHVVNMIQAYKNLSQGRNFTSQISRIKLMDLLRTRYAGQVRKYGETYHTDRKMYKTHFKKTYCNTEQDVLFSVDFTSSICALKIENTTSKKSLVVDKNLFKKGNNQMRVPKGETVVIEFPVTLSFTKMSGYLRNRKSGQYLQNADYKEIEGLVISASQVHAHNQHVMFIDQQNQVMGIGIGPIVDEVDESSQIKMIDRPVNCQGPYLKATTGKYFRLLLTEQNKLFINGRCKQFVAGPVDVNAYVKGFHEITNIYPLSQDEKIVDVAGGRNFIIVVTDKGGIYASGTELYRPVEQQVLNKQSQGTAPYKITMQQGWQATKCWANDLYYNFWVLAEKIGDSNVKKTFSLGGDYDMVGAADSAPAPNWREPAFPENTYMKTISSRGMFALGIDQDDNVWEWGNHGNNKEEFYVKARENLPMGRSTPVKFIVFKKHEKTPIRAVCGQKDTAMFLTKDNTTGDHELYGYASDAKDGMFGLNATDAFGSSNFVLISQENISHNDIVDFAATRTASYIITRKDVEQLPSILEDQPLNRDLIHFYKDRKGWHFVTQKDYEAKKNILPEICFATRHPIKDFQTIKDDPSCLPNLDLIKNNTKSGQKNNNPFPNITTTMSNKPIAKNSSLYYAKYDLAGEQYELYASHEEVIEGGNVFDMTPIIFYVMKSQIIEPSQLEMIDQKKLFTQSDQDDEELRFSVINLNLDAEEILRIPSPTTELASKIYNLQNFDFMQDIELIRAIDFQRQTEFKNAKIEILKDIQFDPQKFALANNSQLRELDNQLLVQRTSLLIQFSQAVATLIPNTFFEVSVENNSIPNQIKINRDLILPSLKRLLFKDYLKDYISFRNIDIKNPIRYNRKMALEFEQQGIKNNPDFIKCSTFGQFFSQSLLSSPDFEMFQNHSSAPLSNDWIDEYHPDDTQENDQTSFIYRNMEKDLMSGMIPLFIQCPNGRLRCGLNRDSFRVNPKAILNKYMKCYQFIGSYIACAMWRDLLWFGVTMAPTFWMILNDEEPKLQDFADEDARLQKRLNKFQSADYGNWPSDEFWVWQDCEDKIHPLVKGGELKQVTSENFEEFEQALLKMLVNEGQKQMSFIKKGMQISLGRMDFFRQYINWHDMMILVETLYEDGKEDRKLSNYQNIQNIKNATTYVNCDENNDQIVRFWNIYKDLNPEDMRIFFNFVGGRTRIGDVPHRFHKKLTIRVDSSIPAGEGPKSLPHQFELVLPETYESEDVFRKALFESMNKGIGLECDPE